MRLLNGDQIVYEVNCLGPAEWGPGSVLDLISAVVVACARPTASCPAPPCHHIRYEIMYASCLGVDRLFTFFLWPKVGLAGVQQG